ncbi:phosphoglycerate mutase-like protein [Annulohypoxylon truncatum]|uniref:phosphoglycerate mutase-like protein n=1 Tax=Annulohypoxylon truncatum TaxID=327061 RepID=UPI0020088F0A|nr:phosphoglycerate mutase-like protein [Annulohypoxylon truncatum]KAI1204657.1 phosphoglycerate mutase-like protein [Annulohypoxylon truncatum]
MLGQVFLFLGIVSLFASWLIKKNNNDNNYKNISDNTTTMKVMQYTAVPGYFYHDTEPEGPGYRARTHPDLGLLDRPYDTDSRFLNEISKLPRDQQAVTPQDKWARFRYFLKYLNERGQGKVEWKLFYVVRHGEGDHNVKEKEVGRAEWERYWSRVDGDGLKNWSDAHLTDYGRQQASNLAPYVTRDRLCHPQSVYTSPLARCLETTDIIYRRAMHDRYIRHAIIKENIRERFGVHVCDRRSTKSWIQSNYPWMRTEHGFSERDELWKPDRRETVEEAAERARSALHDIWEHDSNMFIAITAHSGFVRALYSAVGHADVWLAPGVMMPVLIKREVVDRK